MVIFGHDFHILLELILFWKDYFEGIGDELNAIAKEIVGNESQERMGLILSAKDAAQLEKIAQRERAPFYIVGEVTEDHHFSFHSEKNNEKLHIQGEF